VGSFAHQKFKSNFAGGRPAAGYFLCSAKRKYPKKRRPTTPACGFLRLNEFIGRLRNSPWLGAHPAPNCGAQTVLAENSRWIHPTEVAQKGKKSRN
jgi:hypothetical protein